MAVRPILLKYKKMSRVCLYCPAPVEIIRVTQGQTGELYIATMCHKCAESEMARETKIHGLEHLGGATFVAEGVDWTLVEHLFRTQDEDEGLH
jgi:hypothetical protein